MRIVALGNAIRAITGSSLPLRQAIECGLFANFRVLDCNGAEGISTALSVLPNYQRADYPDYDMRQFPFEDASFDLIVHSDTLEHIQHPVLALRECRRILGQNGRLCCTVPIIVGRLTRDRAGLEPSFHGDPIAARIDHIVHTEFGADAWKAAHQSGFSCLALHQVDFPRSIAISAWDEVPLKLLSDEDSASRDESYLMGIKEPEEIERGSPVVARRRGQIGLVETRRLILVFRLEAGLSRGDLSEAEWRVLKGLLPVDAANRGRGRSPQDNRSIINGILWQLSCGTPWHDVPPECGN